MMVELEDLAEESLITILELLPHHDRLRIYEVCRRLRRIVSDRWLWKSGDLAYPSFAIQGDRSPAVQQKVII